MDGVPGGKRIIGFAGNGDAVHVTFYGQPVGPLLIESHLKKTRQPRCYQRRKQKMIAGLSGLPIAAAALKPPADGQSPQHMLITSPCENIRGLFGLFIGVTRDRVRDGDIHLSWFDSERHASTSWLGAAK